MLFLDLIKLRLIKPAFIITFVFIYLSGRLSRREAPFLEWDPGRDETDQLGGPERW